MLISHHPASAECLQLGEGMLLCGFDLDKALSSRDPLDCMAEAVADDTKRIGTTCGGGIFRAVPREFDPESGSHRLPFAGSIRLIDWRVTLSGTMLDVTPEIWRAAAVGHGNDRARNDPHAEAGAQAAFPPMLDWYDEPGAAGD